MRAGTLKVSWRVSDFTGHLLRDRFVSVYPAHQGSVRVTQILSLEEQIPDWHSPGLLQGLAVSSRGTH
jgi:hypothetical protein